MPISRLRIDGFAAYIYWDLGGDVTQYGVSTVSDNPMDGIRSRSHGKGGVAQPLLDVDP